MAATKGCSLASPHCAKLDACVRSLRQKLPGVAEASTALTNAVLTLIPSVIEAVNVGERATHFVTHGVVDILLELLRCVPQRTAESVGFATLTGAVLTLTHSILPPLTVRSSSRRQQTAVVSRDVESLVEQGLLDAVVDACEPLARYLAAPVNPSDERSTIHRDVIERRLSVVLSSYCCAGEKLAPLLLRRRVLTALTTIMSVAHTDEWTPVCQYFLKTPSVWKSESVQTFVVALTEILARATPERGNTSHLTLISDYCMRSHHILPGVSAHFNTLYAHCVQVYDAAPFQCAILLTFLVEAYIRRDIGAVPLPFTCESLMREVLAPLVVNVVNLGQRRDEQALELLGAFRQTVILVGISNNETGADDISVGRRLASMIDLETIIIWERAGYESKSWIIPWAIQQACNEGWEFRGARILFMLCFYPWMSFEHLWSHKGLWSCLNSFLRSSDPLAVELGTELLALFSRHEQGCTLIIKHGLCNTLLTLLHTAVESDAVAGTKRHFINAGLNVVISLVLSTSEGASLLTKSKLYTSMAGRLGSMHVVSAFYSVYLHALMVEPRRPLQVILIRKLIVKLAIMCHATAPADVPLAMELLVMCILSMSARAPNWLTVTDAKDTSPEIGSSSAQRNLLLDVCSVLLRHADEVSAAVRSAAEEAIRLLSGLSVI